MQDSKLLQLIKALNREEFRQLGQFVRSPYFNSNQRLISFYGYLSKYYPGLFSPNLDKEKAFYHLFELTVYDDVRMRQLMFKMTKLVEQFLVVQEAMHSEENSNRLLTQALGRRDLYPHFERLVKRSLARLQTKVHKDISVLHQLLFYNHEYFFHPDTHKFKAGVQSIENCMLYLDQYFKQAKLRYSSELVTRSVTLSEDHEIWLFDEVLAAVHSAPSETENTLTKLFYQLLSLYADRKNTKLFQEIKNEFTKVAADIPDAERIELYQQLSNFAVSKINEGNRGFRTDFFELAKIALTYNILLDKNRITDATFTNLVAIASALKEFAWTEKFILSYEGRLELKFRESAVGLAWAYWHYQQGDFKMVLEYLQEVAFLPSYGFRAKSLRLRTYFELFQTDSSYHEALLSDIRSFESYVRRHTNMSEQRKKTYLNFILYTKQLVKLQTNPNSTSQDKAELTKDIEEKESLVIRQWLLEKLKEL